MEQMNSIARKFVPEEWLDLVLVLVAVPVKEQLASQEARKLAAESNMGCCFRHRLHEKNVGDKKKLHIDL